MLVWCFGEGAEEGWRGGKRSSVHHGKFLSTLGMPIAATGWPKTALTMSVFKMEFYFLLKRVYLRYWE